MLWIIGNVFVLAFAVVTYMLFSTVSRAISPQGQELIDKSDQLYAIARMGDGVLMPEERADNDRTIALVEELKTLRHCKQCLRSMLVIQACVEIALASVTIQIYA